MRINQVSSDYVRTHWTDDNIYRVLVCDDGNYGKSHRSARMKSLRSMTIDEFEASLNDSSQGFIVIEE